MNILCVLNETAQLITCSAPSKPLSMLVFGCLPSQEEQEELAAVEVEARQELRAAQQALAEAQEALAVTSDKV